MDRLAGGIDLEHAGRRRRAARDRPHLVGFARRRRWQLGDQHLPARRLVPHDTALGRRARAGALASDYGGSWMKQDIHDRMVGGPTRLDPRRLTPEDMPKPTRPPL